MKKFLISLALLTSVANATDFGFIVHCGNDDYQHKAKEVTIKHGGTLEFIDVKNTKHQCLGWEVVTATRTFSNNTFTKRPDQESNKGFRNGGLKIQDDASLDFYPSKSAKLRKQIASIPERLVIKETAPYQPVYTPYTPPVPKTVQVLYHAGIPSQAVLHAANPQLPVVLMRDNTGNLIRVQ